MALMHTGAVVFAAVLCSILVAAPSIAQNPPPAVAKAKSGGEGPGTDLIGRPVELDLSKGVQAPFRDTSTLPATFAEAAKTQPVNSKWGTVAYRPKSRRDLTGIWINQGGIGWTPGIPPGRGQKPPLTPAYAKMFADHLADAAAGKPTGDPTAACLPPGMPRVMTMTYPMEITMGTDRIMVYAEWDEQVRRIFTDGRPLPVDPDPTYNGESVGHWEGNFLLSTAYGFRLDTNMESSGLPKSDKAIAYERIWLADDDTLRDEFTLVDPLALVKPWTVTKTYKRAPADFKIEPYVCLENNRNPIAPDGSIQAILQSGDKPKK
jgi:hypothetical protein